MTTINRHIEDYLDYYCSLKYPPEYAILLKGPWGAGKTWFVKKYCERLKEKSQKYLYVSLYGLSTFDEIEDAFFHQLHPLLSSKAMAIAGKVLKGVIKANLKIDLDTDKKEGLTIASQVPDLKLPDYLKSTEGCILIFDDLERCVFNIEKILGYINHFVEHQGLKVIIVANEDEITKNEEGQVETERSYKRIKEKLIGKTFKVLPDLETALKDFIEKVTVSEAQKVLLMNMEEMKALHLLSGYENLRHLKQTVWDFERLFDAIPDEAKKKDQLLKHLLQVLLAFSFEIKRGTLLPSDISEITGGYFVSLGRKEGEATPIARFIKKYPGLNLYETLLPVKCWIDFFDEGFVDTESVKESLLKSIYFEDENTPAWVRLWHFLNLSDEDFDPLLKKVETEFRNRKFREVGIIKHIVGLLLRLSDAGVYKKEKGVILKKGKQYIDFLIKEKDLVSESRSLGDDSYGGLGFQGMDLDEFKEFLAYVQKMIEQIKIESLPGESRELLNVMGKDVDKFCQMIFLSNSPDQIYYRVPILRYIKPQKFMTALMRLNPEQRREVMFALDKRYEYQDINKLLVEESQWLKDVRGLMIEEERKRLGKISGYIIKSSREHYIDKFIKKLNSGAA